MAQAYYVGNSMIVPQQFDLPALRDIFVRQPPPFFLPERERNSQLQDFYAQVTKTFPDFLPQNVCYLAVKPLFFEEREKLQTEISYEIPLENGRVNATMRLMADLGTSLNRIDFYYVKVERKIEVYEKISGQSGIVVSGEYRHGLNTYNSLKIAGLQRTPRTSNSSDRLDTIPESLAQTVFNALCAAKPLLLQDEVQKDHFPALSINRSREICAHLKDLRFEKLKEAQRHIGEFFGWVASHPQEIKTLLVASDLYKHLANFEHQLQGLQKSREINLTSMPTYSAQALETIAGLMNNLHPPENRRMEYLVDPQ